MPFCSTIFLRLSGNLKIPSFQNLSGFSAKNFSKWFFTSTKELKLFPLREFDRNRWKSEGARAGEYGEWGRTSQPSSNNFCRIIKEWSRALSWWNTTSFQFAISGFCLIAVFNSSNWEQYSSEFIVSLFGRNTGFLPNSIRHRAWPSLDEDRLLEWLKVVHSAFPKIFFAQHYCKWSIFHPPSLLASKMMFPRCVYRASRKWKCDPSDFSPLNRLMYGFPIHQNGLCSQASQNTRRWWISTFLIIYVSYSVDYSQCFNLIFICGGGPSWYPGVLDLQGWNHQL